MLCVWCPFLLYPCQSKYFSSAHSNFSMNHLEHNGYTFLCSLCRKQDILRVLREFTKVLNWNITLALNKMANQERNNQIRIVQFWPTTAFTESMVPMKWKCLPRIYYARPIYSEAIQWNGNTKSHFLYFCLAVYLAEILTHTHIKRLFLLNIWLGLYGLDNCS